MTTLNHNWRSAQTRLDAQKAQYSEMRATRSKCAMCSGADGEGALLSRAGVCWVCGREYPKPKLEGENGMRTVRADGGPGSGAEVCGVWGAMTFKRRLELVEKDGRISYRLLCEECGRE